MFKFSKYLTTYTDHQINSEERQTMITFFIVYVFSLLVIRLDLALGARGSFTRNGDDEFQMLIAGGILPEKSHFVRSLVSIRTLKYIQFHGDNHFCTGIILTSRTILTAAHCVTDYNQSAAHPDGLLVVFGVLTRLERYRLKDTRRVKKILIHPNYKRYLRCDVALLFLHSIIPINYGHAIKNFRSVKPLVLYNGMKCFTMGWGQVYPHGPYSNEILYLDVYIRDDAFCNNMDFYEAGSNICVEPDNYGEVCPGDLGSPLICQGFLCGIVGGMQQCEGSKSIKFSNTSKVWDWINDILSSGIQVSVSRLIFISNGLIMAYL